MQKTLLHTLIAYERDRKESPIAVVDSKVPDGYRDEKLVELGIVRCGIDAGNHLCSIDEIFNEIINPDVDLPADFTKQTRITNDMARGIYFDESRTVHVGSQPDRKGTGLGDDRLCLTIAHILRDVYKSLTWTGYYNPVKLLRDKICENIAYDSNSLPDSILKYDWNQKFTTNNLEILLAREGFFFDSTNAYMRCMAMALMLNRAPEIMDDIHDPDYGDR